MQPCIVQCLGCFGLCWFGLVWNWVPKTLVLTAEAIRYTLICGEMFGCMLPKYGFNTSLHTDTSYPNRTQNLSPLRHTSFVAEISQSNIGLRPSIQLSVIVTPIFCFGARPGAIHKQGWRWICVNFYLCCGRICCIWTTGGAGIIERKLRSTKVRLFTVPCCSIILFSSEGVKKNVSEFTPIFFRRFIILVGALLFYNSVFPHFSHISHFRSIINVSRAPFYN